jgi:hypothetical protein
MSLFHKINVKIYFFSKSLNLWFMRYFLYFLFSIITIPNQSIASTAFNTTNVVEEKTALSVSNHTGKDYFRSKIEHKIKVLSKPIGGRKWINPYVVIGLSLVLLGIFGLATIPMAAIKMGILRVPLAFLSGLLATGSAFCFLKALRDMQKLPERWKGKLLAKIGLFLALGALLTLLTYAIMLFSFL